MIGIEEIGVHISQERISNYERKEKFGIDDHFIEEKIGVRSVARKGADEETSDLCLGACADLRAKNDFAPEEVEMLVVVTQNPDCNIPHVSAVVHGKLGLPESCACFDISLGCSGFVYALSVAKAFMQANGMRRGLLFTADPYSKVVDSDDKNTTLLFGDAAAVTLLTDAPVLVPEKFSFGTIGREHEKLTCAKGPLYMHGRGVFNFAAKTIPDDIRELLEKTGLTLDEVDRFLLHQGSKIIVETIAAKLGVPREKVPYVIHDYGNTVSSTLPILLADELAGRARTFVMSGFGVGLSWASGLLRRVDPK